MTPDPTAQPAAAAAATSPQPAASSPPSAAGRKRTARACDRCSIARTKCDGKNPCYRCLNLGILCEYNRTIKKRGKGSDSYPLHPRKLVKTQPDDGDPPKPKSAPAAPRKPSNGAQNKPADDFWQPETAPSSSSSPKLPSPEPSTAQPASSGPLTTKPLPVISVSTGPSAGNYQHLSQTTSILPQLHNFLKLTTPNKPAPLTSGLSTPSSSSSNLVELQQQNHTDVLQASSTLTSFSQGRPNFNTSNTTSMIKILNQSSKTVPFANSLSVNVSQNPNGNVNTTSGAPANTDLKTGGNANLGNSSIHNPLNFNVQLLSHLASSVNYKSPTSSSLSTPTNPTAAVTPTESDSATSTPNINMLKSSISRILPSLEMITSAPQPPAAPEPKTKQTEIPPETPVTQPEGASSLTNLQNPPISNSPWLGTKSPFSADLITSIFDRPNLPPTTAPTTIPPPEDDDDEDSQDQDLKNPDEDGGQAPAQRAPDSSFGTGTPYTPAPPPPLLPPPQHHMYPVLDPIIRDIDYMPLVLTSEFLEIYFTNTVYSVAPVLRKSSMLCDDAPRKCSPALLYSILYVSAHASNHPIMTSGSEYKNMLISKLLDSIMLYLQPMREEHSHEYDLDDVIAYVNIGVVESASDFKPSTMRWWNMAVTLARQLKLNKEIPTLPEEAREERRRTWWALFMIDRHLALCFNKPCLILDSESLELFFPISQDIWDYEDDLAQVAGDAEPGEPPAATTSDDATTAAAAASGAAAPTTGPPKLYPPEEDRNRRRGLQCTVVESGVFGMYLPLMTLLGGIIEIHFFELSPMFSRQENVLQSMRENYRNRLKAFEYSLEEFYTSTVTADTYLLAWKEYCRCVLQVLHILLEGYWDPTAMLDDIDVLLNDARFGACLHNAIEAARCVERILRVDPTLQMVPFFFGIQLLHAGFIPYCMSERYGTHTATDVAQACELFARAHEVSIATLSTQYQVNYRALLHGVIRDMKHTTVSVNDRIVSTNRRRILMSMYRWNAGGTGLAV